MPAGCSERCLALPPLPSVPPFRFPRGPPAPGRLPPAPLGCEQGHLYLPLQTGLVGETSLFPPCLRPYGSRPPGWSPRWPALETHQGPYPPLGLPRGAPAGCSVGWQTALTVRACRDLPLCDIIQLHGGRRVHRAGHPPPEHRRRLRRGEGLHHTRGHRRLPHGADQRESPAPEGPRGPCGRVDRHPWGGRVLRQHGAMRLHDGALCTPSPHSPTPQGGVTGQQGAHSPLQAPAWRCSETPRVSARSPQDPAGLPLSARPCVLVAVRTGGSCPEQVCVSRIAGCLRPEVSGGCNRAGSPGPAWGPEEEETPPAGPLSYRAGPLCPRCPVRALQESEGRRGAPHRGRAAVRREFVRAAASSNALSHGGGDTGQRKG